MIFAGYESAEEMENWTDYYTTQPAWGEYLQSLQGVVTWLSTELVQNALVFDGKMDVETFTKWERDPPVGYFELRLLNARAAHYQN